MRIVCRITYLNKSKDSAEIFAKGLMVQTELCNAITQTLSVQLGHVSRSDAIQIGDNTNQDIFIQISNQTTFHSIQSNFNCINETLYLCSGMTLTSITLDANENQPLKEKNEPIFKTLILKLLKKSMKCALVNQDDNIERDTISSTTMSSNKDPDHTNAANEYQELRVMSDLLSFVPNQQPITSSKITNSLLQFASSKYLARQSTKLIKPLCHSNTTRGKLEKFAIKESSSKVLVSLRHKVWVRGFMVDGQKLSSAAKIMNVYRNMTESFFFM